MRGVRGDIGIADAASGEMRHRAGREAGAGIEMRSRVKVRSGADMGSRIEMRSAAANMRSTATTAAGMWATAAGFCRVGGWRQAKGKANRRRTRRNFQHDMRSSSGLIRNANARLPETVPAGPNP